MSSTSPVPPDSPPALGVASAGGEAASPPEAFGQAASASSTPLSEAVIALRQRRRPIPLAVLPTLLTTGNLLAGFAAVVLIADGAARGRAPGGDVAVATLHFYWAGLCILLGMVCDALDGRVARLTRTTSDFGGQYDSICDVVTFGMAPALLVRFGPPLYASDAYAGYLPTKLLWIISGLYLACAALRLARFNVETSDDPEAHERFEGLPSPGAAGAIVALPFLAHEIVTETSYLRDVLAWCFRADRAAVVRAAEDAVAFALPALGLLAGALMVSRLPYLHVANRFVRGRRPFAFVVQTVFLMAFLLLMHEVAIAAGFLAYAFAGPAAYLHGRVTGRWGREEPLF